MEINFVSGSFDGEWRDILWKSEYEILIERWEDAMQEGAGHGETLLRKDVVVVRSSYMFKIETNSFGLTKRKNDGFCKWLIHLVQYCTFVKRSTMKRVSYDAQIPDE